MKRVVALVTLLVLAGAVVFAHNGSDHVRGVVTVLAGAAITVRTAPNVARTLSLTDETRVRRGTKTVPLNELQVGDRVVAHVKAKTAQVLLVEIGEAPAATVRK
ncbi:MAG: hypothetical protein ABUS56_06490 [Acidobacteriota bacterium]